MSGLFGGGRSGGNNNQQMMMQMMQQQQMQQSMQQQNQAFMEQRVASEKQYKDMLAANDASAKAAQEANRKTSGAFIGAGNPSAGFLSDSSGTGRGTYLGA